ncbi:hypothetical protein Cob_v005074 [Colletotrichum orbiculare MAFF 240422]|uniref:Uncharacterized protein n=1 Tax=Colletotrichum orbiculare (strain 104-T / ATCC 96160 / CBS 514.97 / LARS 414 / MAFF 240422) TaxID=1213857 RepID=A0A484FWN9_COLOR|nr:hypothetical protein Cob_v005074 [Colletotrichum orbiculare MAFF 240422]
MASPRQAEADEARFPKDHLITAWHMFHSSTAWRTAQGELPTSNKSSHTMQGRFHAGLLSFLSLVVFDAPVLDGASSRRSKEAQFVSRQGNPIARITNKLTPSGRASKFVDDARHFAPLLNALRDRMRSATIPRRFYPF